MRCPRDLGPTDRQREVVLAYGRLGDIAAVAVDLGLNIQTVKNHLSDAYHRLGVHSGPQAVYALLSAEYVAEPHNLSCVCGWTE